MRTCLLILLLLALVGCDPPGDDGANDRVMESLELVRQAERERAVTQQLREADRVRHESELADHAEGESVLSGFALVLGVVLVLALVVLAAEHRHRRVSNAAIQTLAEAEDEWPEGDGP